MTYTPPQGDALTFDWQGAPNYSPPLGGSIEFHWGNPLSLIVIEQTVEPVEVVYPAWSFPVKQVVGVYFPAKELVRLSQSVYIYSAVFSLPIKQYVGEIRPQFIALELTQTVTEKSSPTIADKLLTLDSSKERLLTVLRDFLHLNGVIGLSEKTPFSSYADYLEPFSKKTEKLFLSFDLSLYGSDIGPFSVYLLDANGVVMSQVLVAEGQTGLSSWQPQTVEFAVPRRNYYIAFLHRKTGDSYRGDLAISNISLGAIQVDISSSNQQFTTSSVNTSDSVTALSSRVDVQTTTASRTAQWDRHTGSTGSSSTGPSGSDGRYYFYTETSVPNSAANVNFWLFTPLLQV